VSSRTTARNLPILLSVPTTVSQPLDTYMQTATIAYGTSSPPYPTQHLFVTEPGHLMQREIYRDMYNETNVEYGISAGPGGDACCEFFRKRNGCRVRGIVSRRWPRSPLSLASSLAGLQDVGRYEQQRHEGLLLAKHTNDITSFMGLKGPSSPVWSLR